MTTVLKATDPLIVPVGILRRAGMKKGDRLEFKAARGVITIVSKSNALPSEETPAQRRVIHAQLAEALDEIQKGRVSRRFDSVEEMLNSLKRASPKGSKKGARNAAPRAR